MRSHSSPSDGRKKLRSFNRRSFVVDVDICISSDVDVWVTFDAYLFMDVNMCVVAVDTVVTGVTGFDAADNVVD